jgi:hypothetical protein
MTESLELLLACRLRPFSLTSVRFGMKRPEIRREWKTLSLRCVRVRAKLCAIRVKCAGLILLSSGGNELLRRNKVWHSKAGRVFEVQL